MALSPQRRYQKELARYGLGLGGLKFNPMKEKTLFAEEGPASSGISIFENLGQKQVDSLVKRTGLSPEEVIEKLRLGFPETIGQKLKRGIGVNNLPSNRGVNIKSHPTDVSGMPELAKAYAAIMDTVRPQDSLSLPDAAKIEAMPDDSPAFAESPLDAIANMIKKAQITQKPSAPKADQLSVDKEEYDARAENFRDKEKAFVENFGSGDQSVTLEKSSKAKTNEDSMSNLFSGGMADFLKALEKDVPTVGDKGELLETYKKEFADATGLDVSGKVDKSSALMAMGLAMMQNRAGKGFNVGNILSAVGEAGEKALPALEKAKNESKQARIAAGKYALQQIKSDENAVTAIKAANRALHQDLALEDLKHQNKIKEDILKAELEGDDSKLVEALKTVGNTTIRIGSQDIILKRGADIEDEGRVVWQDPVLDSKNVATAYRKTTGGLNSVNRMSELLELMSSEAEGKVGGTAFQGFIDKAKEVGKSIGMDLGQYTGGENVSPKVQYEKLSTALLANFKRYLTSETGNGISTYDVKQIEDALGKFSTFDDIAGAKMALAEIRPMFTSSLNVLEPLVSDFSDRNQYRAGVVGDEQYNDVMNFLSIEFGKTNLITPTQITRDDGTVVTEWDLTY